MDPLIRFATIVLAIAATFVLLFLNKYVVKNYWLAAIEDGNEQESSDE